MQKTINQIFTSVNGLKKNFRHLKYTNSTINIALLALLVSGCGKDLTLVKEFGETAGKFKEKSTEIALDIYKSCLRSFNYTSLYRRGDDDIFTEWEKIQAKCNRENKPASDSVIEVNKILINYMEALGEIANNKSYSTRDDLDKIRESLTKLKIPVREGQTFQLKKTDVDTGFKITNFILNAIKGRFRRKHVKKAILCTNSDMQLHINGLQRIFKEGYIDLILRIEELRIQSYYTTLTNQLVLSRANILDFERVKDKINQDIKLIQNKEIAATNYIEFLEKTAEAHQELYDMFLGKDKPPKTPPEQTKLCEDYLADPPKQESVNSKFILKPDEIKQARKILLKYKANIKPLLSKDKN